MRIARPLPLALFALSALLVATSASAQPAAEAPAAAPAPREPADPVEDYPAGPYARRGVRELGGAGQLSLSKNSTTAALTPFVGWFVADGLELSLLVNLTYTRSSSAKAQDFFVGFTNDKAATALGYAALEPSYHLRASPRVFPFVGVGVGAAYVKPTGDDGKAGFALAPRAGVNLVVGRTGVFTPALNLLYTSTNQLDGHVSYGVSGAFSVFF